MGTFSEAGFTGLLGGSGTTTALLRSGPCTPLAGFESVQGWVEVIINKLVIYAVCATGLVILAVWPEKSRQMSIKVAQKWFH